MVQIVHISAYREKVALQAGYKAWRIIFRKDFSIQTRLGDLTPHTLGRLADPVEPCELLYYPLILGFLGHDANQAFEALENKIQIQVVDIHLFLADQVRFEMMWRMGWLSHFSAGQCPLFDMVRRFEEIREYSQREPPLLAKTHTGYPEYKILVPRDQQVFIRRLFPSALDAFKRQYLK